jgi:calcyphosin
VSSNKLKVFESVILRIKRRLASKGTRGFLQLERALKQADSDHDTLLTPDEFTQVIKAQRIDITPTECASVYQLFDN